MGNARLHVIDYLKKNKNSFEEREITIGIDSAIDRIVRVVESKSENNEYEFFGDMAQFGNHIVSKSGMSCGIEICERFTKLGGNAPIMSNALGALNTKVNCVSPLGYPEIDPVFKELSENCNLYTIGNPAYTTALEFENGKIMLGQVEHLDKVDWNAMKESLGLEKIKCFFNSSNLIGLVNWSCMINFNNILSGILQEILLKQDSCKSQIVFFDLADFSKRERKDICEAAELIHRFNEYYKVVLGLNENEARLMYRNLLGKEAPEDLLIVGQSIYDYMKVDSVVIHTLTNSIAWHGEHPVQVPSLYVQKPRLSTGGGDNFNAGLCFGLLIGLDFEGALYTANALSGFYVRNAKSPDLEELIETLENWESLMEYPV